MLLQIQTFLITYSSLFRHCVMFFSSKPPLCTQTLRIGHHKPSEVTNCDLVIGASARACYILQRKRHYWRLDTKAITLFNDDSSSRYYREMLLSDIQTVDELAGQRQGPDGRGPPVFTITMQSMPSSSLGWNCSGCLAILIYCTIEYA